MAAVDDVFTFLTDQGLGGGATGWDLIRRRIMDSPASDQLIVITEDGGSQPEMKAAAGIGDSALSDPGVMITVRAKAWESDTSLAKAAAIQAALHSRLSQTLVASGTVYFRVRSQTSEPVFAGFDDQNRPIHTISFRLLKLVQ